MHLHHRATRPPARSAAAWRHEDARDGFEVVFLTAEEEGLRFDGQTVAVEGGRAWAVRYSVVVDAQWLTRSAHVVAQSAAGSRETRLEAGGTGRWLVDGVPVPELSGCLDVDLESSVVTNALPVRRLRLAVGRGSDAPAAFVRAPDLRVERLEQRYLRVADEDGQQRYDYTAPRFDYSGRLVYDADGLLLDYPGIAVRVR